ncbi:hypothetical protein ACO0LF_28020 [Undibacterium sp. Di27W]|uniref:hypothetical protein n=1 Tax=Undibacterium sp. Di27W TaxID=3413036 RepID=UPI003BF37DD5
MKIIEKTTQFLRHFFVSALLLHAPIVCASEVQLSLQAKNNVLQANYSVSLPEITLHKIASITGQELPQIARYTSKNRKLMLDELALADADEVLFQSELDNLDIVIIHHQYNSFLGPLKLLSAMSGHPVQVDKIILLVVKSKAVIETKEITKQESTSHWLAYIYK